MGCSTEPLACGHIDEYPEDKICNLLEDEDTSDEQLKIIIQAWGSVRSLLGPALSGDKRLNMPVEKVDSAIHLLFHIVEMTAYPGFQQRAVSDFKRAINGDFVDKYVQIIAFAASGYDFDEYTEYWAKALEIENIAVLAFRLLIEKEPFCKTRIKKFFDRLVSNVEANDWDIDIALVKDLYGEAE